MYTTAGSPQQGGADLLPGMDFGAWRKLYVVPPGWRDGTVWAARRLDEQTYKLAAPFLPMPCRREALSLRAKEGGRVPPENRVDLL
jgi:hypothetical protein